MEEWRNIKGFEGLYQVSSTGRVKSLNRVVIGRDGRTYHYRERYIKQQKRKDGYFAVQIFKNSNHYTKRIHRLVAETFLECPGDKFEVNHKDGNKENNSVENLEWVTRAGNIRHAISHGLMQHIPLVAIEAKKKKIIRSDGVVFGSMTEAARESGANVSNVCAVCQGRLKTTHGYGFRYFDGKESDER